jgi:L-lysine exporter family protein LysE/ArgO
MFDAHAQASFVTGLTLGGSLIVAIGAQNAFVLRQGLRREHVGPVVLVCVLLDVLLMSAGITGVGAATQQHPVLLQVAAFGGALVLVWYGLAAFRRAYSPHSLVTQSVGAAQPVRQVVVQALSISLLNPHVYLDTVVLVGSIGARQAAGTQGAFLAGASLASSLWFVALGFGARALSPLFASPASWRVLDAGIGVTMWWIAYQLATGSLAC